MTFVAGLIADDGIVCIGDGMAQDEAGGVITDKEVKLFDLSPTCVFMPAGVVFKEIKTLMGLFRSAIQEMGKTNTTSIAALMAHAYACNDDDKAPDQSMIFAGYDKESDGTMTPKLYLVDSSDWKLRGPGVRPYIPGGIIDEALIFLDQEYKSTTDRTLNKVNIMALRAMQRTIVAHSNEVNGDIALWNIKPDGHIDKLSRKQIDALLDEVGVLQ